MKLLTLNTHSLAEPDCEAKTKIFLQAVLEERPDVMALQEVNQTAGGEDVSTVELLASGYMECPNTMPRVGRDNHAFRTAVWLAEHDFPCFWSWVPAKLGYDKYDEGTAIFTRRPILEVSQFYLTRSRDYKNWKTRKTLAVRTEAGWFFSLHMGWWKDEEEPFLRQWETLSEVTAPLRQEGDVWLMGDFNSPAETRGEGYDQIAASGWEDAFLSAEEKGGEITVPGAIDGWRNAGELSGMRMDFIWHRGSERGSEGERTWRVSRAGTVFDGENRPAVSDHFGVMAEYERRE